MKYHFSIRRYTYAIDDNQNQHELRPYIRGIIGALATLVSFIAAQSIPSHTLENRHLLTLLCVIVFVVVHLTVVFISHFIILLLARHGCKRLFEMNQEDNLVNKL